MAKQSKIILSQIDTRAPKDLDKKEIKASLSAIYAEISELQNLLFAERKHSVLLILQGMDASGKDGLVKNVFSQTTPNGVESHSFKVPTAEELAHDFLWRVHSKAPGKGTINIFNRSHYEDILVTRVHGLCSDKLAESRMDAINNFEKLLVEQNQTTIIKCYLHVSREKQTERLLERQTNPEKMWKFNANDSKEAEKWSEYMRYYEEAFSKCNDVPWHIIPSDQNWYKSYLVATLLRDALKNLKMKYPGL